MSLTFLRIQFRSRIGLLALRRGQALSGKVRVLRDLVLPHDIDSLRLENLGAVLRALAVVEQCSKDLHVLGRLRISSSTTTVEQSRFLLVCFGIERLTVDVIALFALARVTWPTLVHRGEVLLHLRRREHVDVLETEWLDDALLDQVVELGARGPLENDARPVDVDSILPLLAWLVHQGHLEDVAFTCVEDVEADRASVVSQLRVEAVGSMLVPHMVLSVNNLQFIAKARCVREQHPQGDVLLLVNQRPVFLQNLDLLQFGTQLVHLLVVVKAQLALLDGLQASNCGKDLGARCDPEDGVETHVFLGVQTLLSRSTRGNFVAILVNSNEDKACDSSGLVASHAV